MENAVRIQVRKCRFTGKLFEEKDLKKYAIHLRKLRAEMSEARHLARVRTTFKAWLKTEKESIHHPNEIPEWFLKNQRTIMDAVNAGFGGARDMFYKTDKFTKFSFEPMRYNKGVSNTHVAPAGGATNWSCDSSLPRGYPGWTTQATGTLNRNKNHMGSYPYSAALNAVGIRTMSGGGGNENWGYGISIFLSDWPGLQATVDAMEQEEIISKLKGTT